MELIRKTSIGERCETVEINILHVNGSVRTVIWNSANIFAADGKTMIATMAQGQDITERKLAEKALLAGDLGAFGEVMQLNTQAQRDLCAVLVSTQAEEIINHGIEFHALGWKVNGAGGVGGSITLLFDSKKQCDKFTF